MLEGSPPFSCNSLLIRRINDHSFLHMDLSRGRFSLRLHVCVFILSCAIIREEEVYLTYVGDPKYLSG